MATRPSKHFFWKSCTRLGIVREVALRRGHDVPVDVDGQTDVADPGEVLRDIDVEELEPLVVVDDQDEGARACVLGRCNQVAEVGLAAEIDSDVVAAQVWRRRPEIR